MLSVWRRAETYDPEKSSPATWIFTIARNHRIDRLRKEVDRGPLLDFFQRGPASAPTPEENASVNERAERLRHAVLALSKDQADVVHAYFCDGHAHAAVGEMLGIPVGTVKSRLRLAVAKLHTALAHWWS